MAKLGINIKIDVTKIDKSRLFQGEKGVYLDLNTFIDTEVTGDYGDHGIVTHRLSKEEREQKVKLPILGNARVYFSTLEKSAKSAESSSPQKSNAEFNDAVPF